MDRDSPFRESVNLSDVSHMTFYLNGTSSVSGGHATKLYVTTHSSSINVTSSEEESVLPGALTLSAQ